MIYGLLVSSDDRSAAVMLVELEWTSPPPPGATWACCRNVSIPGASVTGHEWAGLDDEPAVWVLMAGTRKLVNHLCNEHGFSYR